MLRTTAAVTRSASGSYATKPRYRCTRQPVVRVYNKKSKEQELEEAYQEQLAYLQRRREKLIAPKERRVKGAQRAESSSPSSSEIAEPTPAKVKSEPSIQIAQEAGRPKREGGNPFGFLAALFGSK